MNKTLHIFQVLTVGFAIMALWFGYKWMEESRRSLWATLIVFQCTNMQNQFLSRAGSDLRGTQCYLDFLVSYYEANSNKVSGSFAEWIVKREYSTTISNTLDMLREGIKVDHGPDPHKWIEAFHREGRETNANQTAHDAARPLAVPGR